MKKQTKLQIQLKLVFNFEGDNLSLDISFSWTQLRGLVPSPLKIFVGELRARNENATRVKADF